VTAQAEAVATALTAIDRACRLIEDSCDMEAPEQKAALELAKTTVDVAKWVLWQWGGDADFKRALDRTDQTRVYVQALSAARGMPI